MQDRNIELSSLLLRISDFAILNLSFGGVVGWSILFKYVTWSAPEGVLWMVICNLLWHFLSAYFSLYKTDAWVKSETILANTGKVYIFHFVLFSLFFLFLFNPQNRSAYPFLPLFYILLFLLLGVSRFTIVYLTEFVAKNARLKRRCVIVGKNANGFILAEFFNNKNYLYSFQGFLDDIKTPADYLVNDPYRDDKYYIKYALKHNIEEIYTTKPLDKTTEVLVDLAENNCMKIRFVNMPDNSKVSAMKKPLYEDFYFESIQMQVSSLRAEPLRAFKSQMKKRLFDMAFSFFVVIFVLSWLYPILGLLIKLSSPGPILFKQKRSGINNRAFDCYKFRSMTVNANSDTQQAQKNDARVTKIGAFIRKTSLDELPQFLNVLKGDMSIVGPRPHMLKHTEMYQKLIDHYMIRQFLKPGITGWAQVNGYRGETKELIQMEKRVEFDIWYMEHWSLMLDVKIVLMTIINIVKGEPEAY